MDGGIEKALPPALRGLSVCAGFLDVRDETRAEDGFAVTPGIKPAIEIEMRTVKVQIRKSGHPPQVFSPSGRSSVSVSFTGATGSGTVSVATPPHGAGGSGYADLGSWTRTPLSPN
jgi:hypothetical protein